MVEFALVVPILLLLLFGMIDYGLFFSNALSVKQGAREAARQGVVGNFGNACSMTWSVAPSDNLKKLGCTTVARTGVVTGETYVKISLPTGWAKGKPLVVCSMVKTGGATGLVPLPDGGFTATKVQMSIEQAGTVVETGGEQALPSGQDWSWC